MTSGASAASRASAAGRAAMLIASVLAGLSWDRLGASTTFYAGAVLAVCAFAALALRRPNPAG